MAIRKKRLKPVRLASKRRRAKVDHEIAEVMLGNVQPESTPKKVYLLCQVEIDEQELRAGDIFRRMPQNPNDPIDHQQWFKVGSGGPDGGIGDDCSLVVDGKPILPSSVPHQEHP